jgi:hypothetical protein
MTQKETSSIPLGRLDLEVFIEHYAQLALIPGWIDHARYQIDIMEKHPTTIYKGIGKLVAQRIKELKCLS